MPDGFSLKEKQTGLLRPNYSTGDKDTSTLGWGRCQLIKGDYYYFGIHISKKARAPKQGDLLYTKLNYNPMYKGYIYMLTKNAIYFKHVTDEDFYQFGTAWLLSQNSETAILDSMVADIKYTSVEMIKQGSEQNLEIKEGPYKGQRLFAAMQKATVDQLKDFLDYVRVRPAKYAGNSWKVSEVFATWMFSGAPTVIKN
jgi:hypothetical protein